MNTEIKKLARKHINGLGEEARDDWACNRIDEVMTDALFGACGAETQDEMVQAKDVARACARGKRLSMEDVVAMEESSSIKVFQFTKMVIEPQTLFAVFNVSDRVLGELKRDKTPLADYFTRGYCCRKLRTFEEAQNEFGKRSGNVFCMSFTGLPSPGGDTSREESYREEFAREQMRDSN